MVEIICRYKGQEIKTFLCSWVNRYKLSEKLRSLGYVIYDIKKIWGGKKMENHAHYVDHLRLSIKKKEIKP